MTDPTRVKQAACAGDSGGVVPGQASAQVLPFQHQVSDLRPSMQEPPNATATLRAPSQASWWNARAGNDRGAATLTQSVPSQAQRSSRY